MDDQRGTDGRGVNLGQPGGATLGGGGAAPPQASARGPEPPPSMFGIILPVLGGFTALVVVGVVFLAMNRSSVDVETPKLMPSREDLGLGERQASSYGNPAERRSSGRDVSRSSGGITGNMFGGFIYPLSTGKLKSEGDWRNKESELSSKAASGDTKAMWHLSQLYESRRCPFRDENQSLMMLQQAADAGFSAAAFDLGQRYERGRGVPQSDYTAMEYYKKAKAAGLSNATDAIKKLEQKMGGGY